MVPSMFVGFDVIPQSASEMNVPLKKIPSILIISICMAAAWYMLMILATTLSAPAELRAGALSRLLTPWPTLSEVRLGQGLHRRRYMRYTDKLERIPLWKRSMPVLAG